MFDWESQSLRAVKEKWIGNQTRAVKEIERFKPQKETEGAGWGQFKPVRTEENLRKTSINTGRIHSLAKKMMAREWARARGRVYKNDFDSQEKEASSMDKKFNRRKNQMSGLACPVRKKKEGRRYD